MRRSGFLALILAVGFCLSGCTSQAFQMDVSTNQGNDALQKPEGEVSAQAPAEGITATEKIIPEQTLTLTIDGAAVDVQWEDNDAVADLLVLAQDTPVVVNTSAYGGFEQVGSLPQSLSRSDVQMTTQPGDIVLYSGNQLVVFFGSNSWSYTKLGHITGLSDDALMSLLGKETANVRFSEANVLLGEK